MEQREKQRPDLSVLPRILAAEGDSLEGLVLRLAWSAGLTRDEIRTLGWSDVAFADGRLVLPDRAVPLDGDTLRALEARYDFCGRSSPYVVISVRSRSQLQPESISRLARLALDRGGLAGVSLSDLRRDYIIRTLETHGWPYAARVSGVAPATLYAKFSAYLTAPPPEEPEAPAPVDEFLMWRLLQAEGSSPVGLALWLSWTLGLQANEILDLTWSQVDLTKNALALPDRTVPLGSTIRRLLLEVRDRRREPEDPHVLLTPNSRRPYDRAWLSKSVRTALIRGGMERATLRDIGVEARHRGDDDALLRYAQEQGSITKREAMTVLGLQKVAAYERLRRLTEQRRLVRVGAKYYPAGTVVPPEEQYDTLRAFLETAPGAYRQDLARLLRVEPRQCTVILHRLVEAGRLVQRGQQYYLPPVPAAAAGTKEF